jgi:hypothetical protein
MEPEFLLFVLLLKADIENAPENLQMELINNAILILSRSFLTDLPKEKFPVLRSFGLRMSLQHTLMKR